MKLPSNDHEIATLGRRLGLASSPDSVGVGCIALITRGLDVMGLERKKLTTLLLCSIAFAVLSGPAVARPGHKVRHHVAHRHHAVQVAAQPTNALGNLAPDRCLLMQMMDKLG